MRLMEKMKSMFSGMFQKNENKRRMRTWRTDTSYNVGDRVRYRGKIYECSTANTSSLTTPPQNSSDWFLVTDNSVSSTATPTSTPISNGTKTHEM
jgi:chitodextrinase